MIKAIAELGRYQKSKEPELTDFDIWIEDSYDGGKYDSILFIVFERDTDSSPWQYAKIDFYENSEQFKSKLIYKRGSSRGIDKTPTAKVAKNIEKTYRQKIKAWFESNKDKSFLSETEKEFLNQIFELLSSDEKLIVNDLVEQHKILERKGSVLSLQFIEGNEKKYVGDFDCFSRFIVQESKNSYMFSKTFKQYSYANDKVCSICNDLKGEVFGYFTSLGFYTVDKPGMVTGGFHQDQSWKNYPVCLDCALDIEMGIKFKEKNLDFEFYGLRYYLIPTILHGQGQTEILEGICDYNKSQKINKKAKITTLNSEEEVLYFLKNYQNHVHFNLLFYDKPQKGVFRILDNIEEVLPSRIKLLYDIKEYVDDLFLFKVLNKKGERIFGFNFGVLRYFFPRTKTRGNDKNFLQIVHKVFAGLDRKSVV